MLIENYPYLLAFLGLAFLGVALLPVYLKNSYLTLPVIYIIVGIIVSVIWKDLPVFDPVENNLLVEKVTELTVIISLMGAGIKVNKPLKWSLWKPSFRLLFIMMPLFILMVAAMTNIWMGLSTGAAVLIGAVLAPTDPVLAGDVQVSSPQSDKKDSRVRFVLTSEAGLNDGLAFPFVYLAGFILMHGVEGQMLLNWFGYEFLYKIIVGFIGGWVCGKVIGWLLFRAEHKYEFQDGLLAIAITILTYGFTEILHGYGFIAVFVAAYVFRQQEKDHEYHAELHDFTDQIEKLLICILLIIFGIAVGQGLLNYLTWTAAVIGLVTVFLIRPLLGYLSLIRSGLNTREKWIISLLGIKGIGSFYYLAFGLHHFNFETLDIRLIWSLVAFIILVSVVFHGITAPIVIEKHERLEKILNYRRFRIRSKFFKK